MITVEKGAVLIYRIFDVASEIDLTRVEALVDAAPGRERLKLKLGPRQPIVMRNAPIVLNLGETELGVRGTSVRVETLAKVWDYGAMSINFNIPIVAGTDWKELVEISAFLESDRLIDQMAIQRASELCKILMPAMKDFQLWEVFEDYVIYFFEKLTGLEKLSDFSKQAELPALILGEPITKLSAKSRELITDSSYQYSDDDLAVIDWNAAIVVEPSGRKEVPDILEFAMTQLLEMRFYDDLLDRRLSYLYDAIEETRGHLFKSKFTTLSRDASMRYIEFSEFIERVDNSLKVVGDFFLATIFRAAGVKYRILDWQNSITRKMNMLARVSELLQGEVHADRSLLLEFIVVLLIGVEVFAAALKWAH